MKKRKVKVSQAVGERLPHDVTQIIPGKFKGPLFKKGHIIKEEDIDKFKKIGKEYIWILDIERNEYHEDEAAEEFKKLAGKNINTRGPAEGKVVFSSAVDGLLLINRKIVNRINKVKDVVFTTRLSDRPVKRGDELAGIRIVPLATKKKNVKKVLNIIKKDKPIKVIPFKKKKVGLIVTGNEVAKGLIVDKFGDIIKRKVKEYNSEVIDFAVLEDSRKLIADKITQMSKNCDFIILTGGMSVDPDDITTNAIVDSGANLVTYGAPILPGNMFLIAYLNNIPVFGVPGAAIFYNITALDIFLPFAFSGTKITEDIVIEKGYGGYCTHCTVCIFPYCGFGAR